MAGTYVIDGATTFDLVLFLSSAPKGEFKDGRSTGAQAVSANGEKKWEASVVCTFKRDAGAVAQNRRAQSDMLRLTITGPPTDPAAGITPGSPVEVAGLKLGHTQDGTKYFTADAIRPLNGRQMATAGKSD
jgi:hypothetical protein